MVLRAAIFAALVLAQLALVQPQSLPTAWTTGIATFYGGAQDGMDPNSPSYGTSSGSCGYGLLSKTVYPYWSVAALSTSNKFFQAGPNDGCGQCFEVKCMNSGGQYSGRCTSSQSVTVTITDSCPECEADHMDLQALVFAKIATPSLGRIDMQYRRVDCTPPTVVAINVDNNVGPGGWLRLVVERTAGYGGITSVSMKGSASSTWQTMTNKFGSAWEVSNTPQLPWDFEFTSDGGQTVTAPGLINTNGQIGSIPTGVQFALSGSSGSTSIAYDSQAAGAMPSTPPASPPGASANATTPPATPPSGGTPPPPGIENVSGGGSCPCDDVVPAVAGGYISCQQQKDYGKCTDSWMVNGRYCQTTCGRCPASCSGGTTSSPTAAGTAITNAGPPPKAGSTPPPAGSSPPPSSSTPPSPSPPGSTPPPGSASTPPPPATGQGSVQTFSIAAQSPPPSGGGTPPPPSSPGGSSSCSCTDTPPGSDYTCQQQFQMGKCGEAFMFTGAPANGFCAASCYRCPACSG